MTLHFASSRSSQLHDSSDLSAGDHRDPGGVVDPGDGGGVQRHADVFAAHFVHAGAQQEAPHRLHLWRHQSDDIDVHHRRPDVSHHDTPLPGSNGARAPAANTSDDDLGGPDSVAGEADRDDHLEIGSGPLHPDVFGGRFERRARRGTKARPLSGEQHPGKRLQQYRVETNASGER